ncbi:phosphatidylinositol-specific phospholipase C domain-containing protein [Streptomyces chitinivorans]|uniref:Phosphatidylinositol-specific phospholipase C domain-containing protein n=1 Tax=Streptomyces chitinivorans TaxID=1257027 RepID=A0ABW7I0X2_9ACTN|nr:phosphatidylinositol-specific phospholipase C domain-containing protein [Streptomyces chitinivorans]MDH2407220.1 phosphatidylinositol-specific phospholipase C domain-containing protein [Streptomyces chitinivorans]
MAQQRRGRAATAVAAAGIVTVLVAAVPAGAAAPGDLPYSGTTSVGVHNAYEKDKYTYFADALDSGASLLELDVWAKYSGGWRVAHDGPLVDDNNCENASSPAELRSRPRNQSLAGCLADMRAWHEANPGHRPVLIKIEMKDGFAGDRGRGPAQFDALVSRELGDALYRPGDLAAGHATLDDAVRGGGWPTRDALAGKFLIHLIPGTVEESNPFDTLWTDREYAAHLRGLAASGRLGEAAAFPAVHRAAAGDPRTRYADASLRPWFVVFDGDASAYVSGGIDTAWYARNGYLLVMTDAHAVAPAISATAPTEGRARDRVALLAAERASVVTSDWTRLPSVLSTVLPRG